MHDSLVVFRLEGREAWKTDSRAKEYDSELVGTRLSQLQTAREMGDTAALLFLIRTSTPMGSSPLASKLHLGISRSFGDIGNPDLYNRTLVGTKHLVEDFLTEITQQLRSFAGDIEGSVNHVELRNRAEFLKSLRHALGNTALLLSGGGSLGVYHVGVLQAILEAGVLPRIIAGSSAGSIIAAMLCTRVGSDYSKLISFEGINYHFMAPPAHGGDQLGRVVHKLIGWVRSGALYDSEYMKANLLENLSNVTFLEAYRRTGRVLNITVSSATSYEMPSLLNYVTAPDVLIWSAVLASCALPGVFKSAALLAKDHRGVVKPWHHHDSKWIDGSVENDVPLKKLAEMFNVNHFVVSQVNPHIYLFLTMAPVARAFGSLYERLFVLLLNEAKHRVKQVLRFGLFRKTCYYLLSILEQPYQGDITIVPRLAVKDLFYFAADINWDTIQRGMLAGQRATWAKLSIIENHCRVELTLDELLCRLKARIRALSGNSVDDLHELLGPSGVSREAISGVSREAISDASRSLEPIFKSREAMLLEDIEDIIGETQSNGSLAQEESQPIEFVKPLYRSASVTYVVTDRLEAVEADG